MGEASAKFSRARPKWAFRSPGGPAGGVFRAADPLLTAEKRVRMGVAIRACRNSGGCAGSAVGSVERPVLTQTGQLAAESALQTPC